LIIENSGQSPGTVKFYSSGGLTRSCPKLTAELNGQYLTPVEVQELFSQLIGKPVENTFAMFPPFYTDCGKNINVGKNTFMKVLHWSNWHR
jgi:hypothetical protein